MSNDIDLISIDVRELQSYKKLVDKYIQLRKKQKNYKSQIRGLQDKLESARAVKNQYYNQYKKSVEDRQREDRAIRRLPNSLSIQKEIARLKFEEDIEIENIKNG